MLQTQVQSLGREEPLEEEMPTTPVSLPGEAHRQRSLGGYSPWGHKESNTMERLTSNTTTQQSHLFSLAQLPVGSGGRGCPPAQPYVNLRGFRPRKLWGRLATQHHLAYSDRLCPSGSAPHLVNTVVFTENSVTFSGAFISMGYLTGIKRQNPGNDSDHKDSLFS